MLNVRQACWIIGFVALILFTLHAEPATQWRTVIGLLVAISVSVVAYSLHAITLDAITPATCLGTITVGFGGWDWGFLLVIYFISSTIWSSVRDDGPDLSDRRDAGQVLANGLVVGLLLMAYQFTSNSLFEWGAAAALASATADTWATEIGLKWNKSQPRLITNWKPVLKGTDGAISIIGTLGGMIGAFLIALLFIFLANYPKIEILSVVFGTGLMGMFLDSLLGATWERKLPSTLTDSIGQKALSNNQVNGLSVAGSAITAMLILI